MNIEEMAVDAIRVALRDGLAKQLNNSYGSNPLNELVVRTIKSRASEFERMLQESIDSCVNDEAFREEIKRGAREALSKVLVERFGGELKKQVNALKSDPLTRVRITDAIAQVVKERLAEAQ